MFGQAFNSGFFKVPCFTDTTDIFKDRSGVALYTLDYDASDSGGATGKYKEGAVFNGTSSQIDTTATLIPSSTDFSISFWIKPQNQFGSILARGLVTSGANAWGFDVSFNNSSNKLRFFRHTGGAYANEHYAETATNSITVGVWQHVVLSFDKSTGAPQFYIDGSAATTNIVTYAGGTGSAMATGNIAFNSSYDGGRYRLGNRSNGGLSTSRFKGTLDHFRVFNKVVSASEVTTLYSDATDTVQVLGDTSCTAFYNFNNSALDLTGSHDPNSVSDIIYKYDGTPTAIDFGVGGKSLYGAKFNGSSSNIELPNSSLGITDSSNFSISYWFNTNSTTQDNQSVIWANASNAGARFGSGINSATQGGDTSVYFGVGTSSFTYINSGTSAFTANTWVHVVCVKSSTTGMSLYVDNVLKATNTGATGSGSATATGKNTIGSYYTGGPHGSFFNGSIDQVRIFNKALNSTEISKLYGNGAGEIACEYKATTTDVNYPVTNVAYYKLDNNAKSELASPHYLFIGDAGNSSSSARLNSVDAEFTYTRPAGYSEWGGSWDPNNKSGSATQTFEESNKKWTKSGSYYNAVWSTNQYFSGKYYAEIEYLGDELIYGISKLTSAVGYGTSLQNGSIYYGSWATHSWKYSTTNTSEGVVLSTNDVIGLAADFDNQILKVYRNNVLFDTVSIARPDGTETNIEYRFGRFGQAALFDGTVSNEIDLNYNTNYNNFSISAWINPSAISSQHPIVGKWWDGSNRAFQFWLTSSGVGVDIAYTDSNTDHVFYNTNVGALSTNRWYFVCVTWENGVGLTLTVDDNTQTHSISKNIRTNTSNWFIGQQDSRGLKAFTGLIDQVRIFSSALDSTQVTKLYNEKPETDTSNFKTVLYEGTGANQYISQVGFDLDVDNGGDGGLVWIKNRDQADHHVWFDTIRGASKYILSSSTVAESPSYPLTLSSFEKNGFFLGTDATTGGAVNGNNESLVAWVWKGGGDASNIAVNSITGSTPSIASDVSANTEAGFSIVKYTGNLSAATTATGQSVGHGLSSSPELIIFKSTSNTSAWNIFSSELDNWSTRLQFDTSAKNNLYSSYPIADPTSSVFYTNYLSAQNVSGYNHIAYCWHSVAGYSKIGSFTGDGSSNKFIDVGFKPSWVMLKNTENTYRWYMLDSARDPSNPAYKRLFANDNVAEATNSNILNFESTGFKIITSDAEVNQSGKKILYMAFK